MLEKVGALAGVDAVVVTGDLAETGAPGEYEQFFAVMDAAGLDPLVEGQDGGHLGQECLAAARAAIAAAPGPVVLAVHHPPAAVGHPLIDAMGLANPDDLAALVTDHPQVRAVLAGHVHTAMVTTFAASHLSTTFHHLAP